MMKCFCHGHRLGDKGDSSPPPTPTKFHNLSCNVFVLDVLNDVMLRRVARKLNNANVAFDIGLELGLPLQSIQDTREQNSDHIKDCCDDVFFDDASTG